MLKSNIRPLSGKPGVPEDSEEEDPAMDDVFIKELDKIQRRVCWGIGLVSFNYTFVKSTTLSPEEQKAETHPQRMERLLMDSKLLSGGIENRFIRTFSSEVREQIKSVLAISGDYTLHEMVEVG